ncbi:hypothetical protein [Aliiruegeria sabulilitoris]|uniref:hypothetical protein n=1 Tax=Aliiruegeria sabulilitoris TaxID=1510458 RepID=UPI00082B6084|nr:hypothetical protein [Aliiruegeria sabulilitoris]NDR55380.1 hypothetical protein [Pseudoruegeria sp. M32A2M]
MSSIRTHYAERLPYGYRFDPETGMEHLFDKGYEAIASRPVAEPWRVTVLPHRKHISAPVTRYFYTTGTDGPILGSRIDKRNRTRLEAILSRFVCGLDVRGLWGEVDKGDPVPKTGGNYLPEAPAQGGITLTRFIDGREETVTYW